MDIPEARTESLVMTNLSRLNSGIYAVTVANESGTVTSSNAVVRVIVPQRIGSPLRLPDGSFRFLFGDSDGGQLAEWHKSGFEVQSNVDLRSTGWVTLTNAFFLTNGMLMLADPNASGIPRRYYRVIER